MSNFFGTIANILKAAYGLVIELIKFLTNNLFVLLILVLLFLGYKVYKKIFKNRKKSDKFAVSILNSNTLEKIVKMNDLSIMKYPYSNIATIYEENNEEHEISDVEEIRKIDSSKALYKIKYKGYVSIGFDMEKLKMGIDRFKKALYIIVPELDKIEPHVDIDSIELAFYSPYLKESIDKDFLKNAYNVCVDDMKYKIFNDEEIKKMARANAINTIFSIIRPLLDNDYKIIIK